VIRRLSHLVRREGGTASVELVAVMPFLLIAVVVVAQLALVGQALWSAGVAARAGARAALVGGSATQAARSALPPSMRRGAAVLEGEGVAVRVAVPRLLPRLPQLDVGAGADFGGDG
jgi:hypothetical protein